MNRWHPACIALAVLIPSCASTHGRRDAGVDAFVRPDAFVERDAGVDGGTDAGPMCDPDPRFWTVDGGFLYPSGEVLPRCGRDEHCWTHDRSDVQDCYDGVCCNGSFDADTCTCTCGSEPGCLPGQYCCRREPLDPESELRCTWAPTDCMTI